MKQPVIPDNEAERIAALDRYDVLDTPAEPAFDALTRLAARILDVPIALVSLVDTDRQWFKSRYGLNVSETPRDVSFCGHVVALDKPLIVEDATSDGRFADNPLVTGEPFVRFYAGYPLRTADGFVLGTLCAIDRHAHTVSAEDLELLGLLAGQTVRLLELRRTARIALEREQKLRTVMDTAVDAIITIDDRGQIESVNRSGARLFGYGNGELTGQNLRILIPPHLRAEHDRVMRQYLLTGETRDSGIGRELTGMRKDGSTFPIEAVFGEMRIGDLRMFTGILRDATRRKATLQQLNDLLSDLAKSREDLLQVLHALQVGTLVLAPDGTVAFANEVFLRLAGLGAEAVVGRRWDDALDATGTCRQALRHMMQLPQGERSRCEARLGVSRDKPSWVAVDVRDDPQDPSRRILFLYEVTEVHELREQVARQRGDEMIGDGPAMHALYQLIAKVAVGDWTVLVEGETGSGKELVARAIHAASPRRDGPFIAVNSAGLTDSLLASQLFGYVKGAFTGAGADQQGLFEAAAGGTLFLDEIGDISVLLQASLLRVLQEREITRLGETKARKVDVRIIVATNRDLRRRVEEGQLREDLLYRIRSARVRVPSLREHPEDIPLLVSSFLAHDRVTAGKLVSEVAPEAMQRLLSYRWPGNVRELRAAVEHAVVRCRPPRIELADLPAEVLESDAPPTALPGTGDERTRILEALRRTGGNRARAARLLGVGRATLYRRLKELGIGREESDGPAR